MWGEIDHASSSFLALHLADQLSGLAWNRVQVWNSMTSVHEFQLGEVQLAYDVHLADDAITTSLVVRKKQYANLVPTSRKRASEGLSLLKGTGSRITKEKARSTDSAVEDIGLATKNSRASLRRARVTVKSWRDSDTGLIVKYSDKAPREDCDQILFTSIRAKQHWVHLHGPNGDSLRTNRTRIVYVNEILTDPYTCNLALNGRADAEKAITAFITKSMRMNDYNAEQTMMAGISKGEASAIVAGSGLESCNVVTLAPQLRLGAYLEHSKRDQIAKQLSRATSANKFRDIDTLLWERLSAKAGRSGFRQAYILTFNDAPIAPAVCSELHPIPQDKTTAESGSTKPPAAAPTHISTRCTIFQHSLYIGSEYFLVESSLRRNSRDRNAWIAMPRYVEQSDRACRHTIYLPNMNRRN